MPYTIKKEGNYYCVVNTETGKEKGRHSTRDKAMKQMNLLRGIEHGWSPTGKK